MMLARLRLIPAFIKGDYILLKFSDGLVDVDLGRHKKDKLHHATVALAKHFLKHA